jgi:hypothetical protein
LTGWKGDFWKRLDPPNDPFTISRDQTPVLFDPGAKLRTNAAGRYAKLPKDAVWGAGAGNQALLVIPSLNLIMVRNGQTLAAPEELGQLKPRDVFEEFHDPRSRILFEPHAVYGDGKGFEPFTPEKLSLGFAKISGAPNNFSGVNSQFRQELRGRARRLCLRLFERCRQRLGGGGSLRAGARAEKQTQRPRGL